MTAPVPRVGSPFPSAGRRVGGLPFLGNRKPAEGMDTGFAFFLDNAREIKGFSLEIFDECEELR
jgi:hypothetical protein